ncbi:unnamed protein product [Peniophora sp. CBMAI 1063]|nr:unnamed protein product [Peniophora sp. CBMAI 1063]
MSFNIDPNPPVATHHDIYPAIDPTAAFTGKTYTSKTVLVTGASRGIGQIIALFFAKAGADVALTARSSLDETVALIKKSVPDAKILTFAADVKDASRSEEVVEQVVKQFGHLDILVANAGTANAMGKLMGDQDANAWWNVVETNVLGVYSYVRPSLKHLSKTSGYVLILTSVGGIARFATGSDYLISKHAIIRLAELIALEYPSVKAVSIHPGGVLTQLSAGSGMPKETFVDTPELAAGTALALTSGRFDWLSPRYIDASWDLGDIEKLKDAIVAKDALINKLALP